jgi:hypothetical protein
MLNSQLLKLSLRALFIAPLAVACSTPATVLDTSPWVRPSPGLQQRIERRAARLPWTHGVERLELVRWFAEIGEPAYEALLKLCQDPRPDVVGSALGALGATGDATLIPVLHELPWPDAEDVELRLERARALLRLGDYSMVPHLIDGLGHDRLMVRALCAQSLYAESHDRFGYLPGGEQEERALAVERWREWWASLATPGERVARADTQ